MENIRKNKKFLTSVLSLILAIAIFFSCFAFPVGLLAKADDNEDEYKGQFKTETVSITNGQFANSSGTFPKTPSSWTGSFIEDSSGSILSGVIDLSAASYSTNSSKYKLSDYPEYANNAPRTPFGAANIPNGSLPHYEGTNTNVLMINTNGASTAYKYKSSSISLAANSFYKFSAWVKTSDYTDYQDSGAAIKISGIEDWDIGFNNINTVAGLPLEDDIPVLTSANNFGWQEFTTYIATDHKAQSVSINLQLGDIGEDYFYPTKGYAFFDNITAYQISPEEFFEDTENKTGNVFVADLNTDQYLSDNNEDGTLKSATEIGSFSTVLSGNYPHGWTAVEEDGTGAFVSVYNPKLFPSYNHFGLTSNPSAPKGIETIGGNNILVIASQNKAVASGLKSSNILIERNRYYRIAAWVKTHNNASVASIAIKGDGVSYENSIGVTAGALSGAETNTNRYGWKREAFYIKGSSVMDSLIHVELWLGQLESKTKGVAMFDDITIETITQKEYTDNVSGGHDVVIDGNLTDDTGISNGRFYDSGTFEEYEYPLPPSNWTMYDASNSGTTNYSTTKVNVKNIKSGIIPIDKEHFDANRNNYLSANNPLPNEEFPRNVLFLGSDELTAFGYRSDSISISPNTKSKIHVQLMTEDISGYGANLVLKNGNNIISTIENIDTDGKFKTFDFYVAGHAVNADSLNLEIWLGLGDKQNNQTKRAAGYVFVKEVGFDALTTEDTTQDLISKYKNSANANVVILDNDYFINYNRYSNQFLMESYDWTLESGRSPKASTANSDIGIFDYNKINDTSLSQAIVPSDFKTDDSGNKNIFMLHNKVANYASARYTKYYTLDSSYYAISVSMKVDIPEEFLKDNPDAVGAGISLNGTTYSFEDIKDSRTVSSVYDPIENKMIDKLTDNEFHTYTFYVHNSDSATTNVTLEISLGGYGTSKEFCQGKVYVADIKIEEIGGDVYTSKTADLDDDDLYTINADLTLGDTDDTTDDPLPSDDNDSDSWWEKNWYVVPSVIFGLALVIALVAVFVRKFIENRPRKAKKVKQQNYDRKAIADKERIAAKATEGETFTEVSFDEFDDDEYIAPVAEKTKHEKMSPKSTEKDAKQPIEITEFTEVSEADQLATEMEKTETDVESVETPINENTPEKTIDVTTEFDE